MKHFLLILIAAVLVVACGPSVDIHKAAKEGNIEAVKQHLAAGVNVDVKDEAGSTPLHVAAWSGHKEIVALLIAEHADVNAVTDGLYTPLDKTKDSHLIDLLKKHDAKHSIIFSVRKGDTKTIKKYLRQRRLKK